MLFFLVFTLGPVFPVCAIHMTRLTSPFRRPTAIGVVRVQSEGMHLSLGDCWWQLGPGELLNQTTDKGIMVTMHLGSIPEGIFDSMLLDLGIH